MEQIANTNDLSSEVFYGFSAANSNILGFKASAYCLGFLEDGVLELGEVREIGDCTINEFTENS